MQTKYTWIFLCLVLGACATSPTGRKQLILMPDSEMNKMGVQAFTELKSKTPAETDAKTVQYIKCVAQHIAVEAKDSTGVPQWEVAVFKDKQVNAFALPGGKIGVYTGLLSAAKTQSQLAAVLGHEVGHVIARHGTERVSQNLATQGGLLTAATIFKDAKNKDLLLGSLAIGAQVGVLLPFSRTHESEADTIGQELMAKAGFDPAESVQLWQNMAQVGGGGGPEFLSTHPSHDTRINQLQSQLKDTSPIFEKARAAGKNPK